MPHPQEGGDFMRKRVFSALAAALLLLVIIAPVQASPILRAPGNRPRLKISGTTATCSVVYKGYRDSDSISVTLKLKQGRTVIATWSDSDTGSVVISESCTVQKGKSYELVMSATVNGVKQSDVSVTATS